MGSKTVTSDLTAGDQAGVGEGFLGSAKIEFQACLQLLAERARSLSGTSRSAIALNEQDRFLYCAASGESAPQIGDSAPIEEFQGSLLKGEPVFGRDGSEAFLLLPVQRNKKTVAFFKLWGKVLGEQELRSMARLEEMVATAIDHLEAAEKSGEVVAQAFSQRPNLESSTSNPAEHPPLLPALTNESPQVTRAVQSCQSCGFPVSDRRSLCVDCEEHALNSRPVRTTPGFASTAEESWLREHFYTIASLVVTALAAAAIYWLR